LICRAPRDKEDWAAERPLEFLASVERFKFVHPIEPDIEIAAEAWLGRRHRGLLQARVRATGGGRLFAEGVLSVTEQHLAAPAHDEEK
jgi:3-hydroxymyristoyl/3-hydroxydecanoyl-(acyl carrier protein) dehydratase